MELRLDRQVAFVAGSSRGIGLAIASRLLAEGCRVVLTGRDERSLQSARDTLAGGDRVLVVCGDLVETETITRALDRTIAVFGGIDHVVANIGTGRGTAGWQAPETEARDLFERNYFASVRLAHAAIPHLATRSGGSILFIASIVAVEATAAPLAYSAAKAALVNHAKNLARQLAPRGIRVNSLAPGNILFEGGAWERHRDRQPAAVDAMLNAEVPLRRFGEPDEIASLAAYLCSPLAAFATGGCYVVDGGQTRSL